MSNTIKSEFPQDNSDDVACGDPLPPFPKLRQLALPASTLSLHVGKPPREARNIAPALFGGDGNAQHTALAGPILVATGARRGEARPSGPLTRRDSVQPARCARSPNLCQSVAPDGGARPILTSLPENTHRWRARHGAQHKHVSRRAPRQTGRCAEPKQICLCFVELRCSSAKPGSGHKRPLRAPLNKEAKATNERRRSAKGEAPMREKTT